MRRRRQARIAAEVARALDELTAKPCALVVIGTDGEVAYRADLRPSLTTAGLRVDIIGVVPDYPTMTVVNGTLTVDLRRVP